MKYLKKFNESARELVELRNELKTFCDENLAFLIDEGYTIYQASDSGKISIIITKTGLINGKAIPFTWNDVKDDFIPFYELLKSKYNLVPWTDGGDDFITFNGWAIRISDREIDDFDGIFTIPGRKQEKSSRITDIRILVSL